jgi:hypothetical protein
MFKDREPGVSGGIGVYGTSVLSKIRWANDERPMFKGFDCGEPLEVVGEGPVLNLLSSCKQVLRIPVFVDLQVGQSVGSEKLM